MHSLYRFAQRYNENSIDAANENAYVSRQIEPGRLKTLRLSLRGRIGLAADAPSSFFVGAAMDSPFDIFKKQKDGTLVWVAAVGQLHTAAAFVADLHQTFPGEYRVFDKRTGEMIPSNEPLQTRRGTLH